MGARSRLEALLANALQVEETWSPLFRSARTRHGEQAVVALNQITQLVFEAPIR